MAWIWTILSILSFLHLLRNYLFPGKKNLPPGPSALPIIGHFHLLGKNPHQDLCKLAREHGPIMYMRLGMVPTIVVSSPAGAELVLKKHDHIFASRPHSQTAKYMSYDHRNIGFAPYGAYWRSMRKLCTVELLSNFRIKQFTVVRKAEVGLLVGMLKQAADNSETVNLSVKVLDLTRDIISLMVFGRKFVDSDMDEETGFKAAVLETAELAGSFNLGDYFMFLGLVDLQGLTRRMKDLSKVFDRFVEKIIDDHVFSRGVKKEAQDFVDTMMAAMESGDAGFEFDRRHVKGVLLDMLIAGMDTSALAVDWAISELIRHPKAMKKLQKELEKVVGMENMVEEAHLNKLEYLDFVVKETLRLHPIAPLLVPHESMEEFVIDGFHIPKNSRVLVNVWAIGRDPRVWHDPEIFYPERFIGSTIDLKGNDFELTPFGSGRRICPGLQLGLVMFKFVLAQLVHCFDWQLPDSMLPSNLDMSEHFGLVISRAQDFIATPKYRLFNAS